ncbi:MAG: hypothetical protein JW892_01280 [Anaerolineae bacterium]|nr:hypothetical protein [Anaerolineae bacterium]
MVAFSVAKSVANPKLSPDALKDVLQALEQAELPPLPVEVEALVALYQTHGIPTSIDAEYPGLVVAWALSEFWCREILPQLLVAKANAKHWTIAFIPFAHYVAPLMSRRYARYRATSFGKSSTEVTLQYLQDPDCLAEWGIDADVAKSVARETVNLADYTFYRWLNQSLASICIILGSMSEEPVSALPVSDAGFARPVFEITRQQPLAALHECVLQAADVGAWVALIGLGGIGKTSMLGAFLRSVDLGKQFDGGLVAFSGNPPMLADTDAGLLRPIVMRLCQQASAQSASIEALRLMLREHLITRRALAIVDNVEQLQSLHWLRDIRGLTVLISTRSVKQAEGLGINSDWQILLGALTQDEARELAVGISECQPVTETDEHALAAVLDLVERYPLAVEIASRIAQRKGWEATQRLLSDVESRKLVLGYHDSASNAWIALEAVWDSLDSEMQERLALLGAVPLLNRHDIAMGQAVWGVSHQVAEASFDRLAQYCLVQPIASGAYRIHALMWELARNKLSGIDPERVAAVKGWEWRYPIQEVWSGWRWWWPCVPKPGDSSWALWDPRVPKTPRGEGFRWLLTIVKQHFWRTEDKVHVLADPLEWVVMHRRAYPGKAAMIAAMCAVILNVVFLSVAGWIRVVMQVSDEPFWTMAMVCLGFAVVFESISLHLTFDQRRIAGWRVLGKSFTESLVYRRREK